MRYRDPLLLALIFVALVALIGRSMNLEGTAPDRSATSHSAQAGGTLALYRWIEALGYDLARLEYQPFPTELATDLLIVLEPAEAYSREEAATVRAWVEAGGVLLLIESRPGASGGAARLLEAFDLRVVTDQQAAPAQPAPALQPALGAPPLMQLQPRTSSVITSTRNDMAPLAGSATAPVLVGLQYGAGYLYAGSALYPFSNAGLHDEAHAALVLNLLRRVLPEARVRFDEIHHGFVGQPSLRTLLLGTRWGQATLYATAIGALYLIFTGRRFGRPLPLRAETARRSSAEYLESMAGLLRRAGKRNDVLAHHRAMLRRRLARSYGLSPDLDDAALTSAIATSDPARARAAADLLARMARPSTDEATMLHLVAEGDALTAP